MKTLIQLVVFLGITTAIRADEANGTPPLPKGETPDRFVLFQGVHPADTSGGQTIYRIDTATGQVWTLGTIPMPTDSGKPAQITYWSVVFENDALLVNMAFDALKKKK